MLKRVRGRARTKVTFAKKLVKQTLIINEENSFVKFVFEEIDRAHVKEKHYTLIKTFNVIQITHERYIYYRLPLEDAMTEVAEAFNNKNVYIIEIHKEASDTNRLFGKYKRVINDEA